MNFAATLLLFRNDAPFTQVLSISRGEDLNDWGLVGGKVDDNESFLEAVVREAEEEAGVRFISGEISELGVHNPRIKLDMASKVLTPIYTGIGKTRLTTTFLAMHAYLPPRLPTTREGTVRWKTPYDLVQPGCTYRGYNLQMFEYLRIPVKADGVPQNADRP